MNNLASYIRNHVERGSCLCGKCVDAPTVSMQPTGHTSDVIYFRVRAFGEPNAEELRRLIVAHPGIFSQVDLFDGQEHNYQELGGWIGNQELALMLMGLGELLELWTLITPRSLGLPNDLVRLMTGAGLITIQSK